MADPIQTRPTTTTPSTTTAQTTREKPSLAKVLLTEVGAAALGVFQFASADRREKLGRRLEGQRNRTAGDGQ